MKSVTLKPSITNTQPVFPSLQLMGRPTLPRTTPLRPVINETAALAHMIKLWKQISNWELCLITTSAVVMNVYSLDLCPGQKINNWDEITYRWESLVLSQPPQPSPWALLWATTAPQPVVNQPPGSPGLVQTQSSDISQKSGPNTIKSWNRSNSTSGYIPKRSESRDSGCTHTFTAALFIRA